MGGWFYNGGMENFQSLCIVDRGVLTLLFYEDSAPPILPTPIFQIPPCNLQPPPPLLYLLLCFF